MGIMKEKQEIIYRNGLELIGITGVAFPGYSQYSLHFLEVILQLLSFLGGRERK